MQIRKATPNDYKAILITKQFMNLYKPPLPRQM